MLFARHPRLRRYAKWTGALALTVIFVAFVFSGWSRFAYYSYRGLTMRQFSLSGGWVSFGTRNLGTKDLLEIYSVLASSGWNVTPQGGWAALDSLACLPMISWEYGVISIPLWFPFVICLIPTAFLFWKDSRPAPVDCCAKCGYDLKGNTTGVCPECGTKIPPSMTAAKESESSIAR